jgi:hypothetical protein
LRNYFFLEKLGIFFSESNKCLTEYSSLTVFLNHQNEKKIATKEKKRKHWMGIIIHLNFGGINFISLQS